MRNSRRARGERGASAVEFAWVPPIFFAVLFAIVTFGFLFAQDLALSNAARQAARFAAVAGHTCDQVQDEALAAAPLLDDLTKADVVIPVGCGSSTGEPCRESAVGANVTVTITYDANVTHLCLAWAQPAPSPVQEFSDASS